MTAKSAVQATEHKAQPTALAALRKAAEHYEHGEWAAAALAAAEAAEAAEADAKQAAAFHLLGLALDNLGQRHKAFQMYERALALDPRDPQIYFNVALTARNLRQLEDAAKAFRAYVAMRPDCAKGYDNLATVTRDLGDAEGATALLRNALKRLPTAANLWNTLGAIVVETGDFDEAVFCHANAQRLDPAMSRAHHNMGYALSHIGPLDKAIESYTRALELSDSDADRAEARHARGLCFAAMGGLGQAWDDYEERFNPRFGQSTAFAIDAPRWQGESLEGRKLLLVGEQGVGDEIMFASMVPDLVERVGPRGKVMIACDQRLVPLFRRSFPQAHVDVEAHTHHEGKPVRMVPWAQGERKPDLYTPMGAPLKTLRTALADFPARVYLKPDPARIRYWQNRLDLLGPGPYVGISWRSGLMTAQRKKFFSALEAWAPVLEKTSVKFINLQYGDCKAELQHVREKLGVAIHDFEDLDLKMNLDDSAALSTALDLVVTAPTAVASLAAATGTETWFLTAGRLWPQLATDRYPWYANTRVLTPKKFGDWSDLMPRLADEIEAFAAR